MGKILFGWEFGASLGHVYPLLRIANRLRDNGHEIVFVCRDVVLASDLVRAEGYKLIQAPFWKNPPIPNLRDIPTPSYADVLVRQGFAYRKNLVSMMSVWTDLVALLKPDLVVADHSPGLSLALRGLVPVFNVGNGFTLPPSGVEEYPVVNRGGKPLMAQERLLAIFNEVNRERGAPLLDRLPQVFDTEGQFVCTVPQLDPYHGVPGRVQVGPLEDSMTPAPLPENPHIFVYMAHDIAGREVVLETVAKNGLPATAYIRGASARDRARYASHSLTMLDKPVDFRSMLPKSSLVIHSGGGGTATACLMTGRPQIMLPTQAEANLNARLLRSRGLAEVAPPTVTPSHFKAILARAAGNREMAERCLQNAEILAGEDWGNALGRIVTAAEAILSPA
ncbi:glycosyltransferase [Sneathiella chinensis]|uniref:glycosyltransferase n=1 Tax=Sneathiella chinensis TaxID=349750 RepID=UPI00146ACD5D|nr:nucleotide disphospho-sugar-binding domain-containing protein [Sneathiella chinensis]